MNTLHMETERVREVAGQMERWALSLLEQGEALRGVCGRLEMAWQGSRADDFLLEGHCLLRQLWDQDEELFTMGLVLCRQADRWEELDQRWRQCFRDFPRSTSGR